MKDEKQTVTAAAAAPTKTATRFTKKQLLGSKRFEERKDALGAILSDTETYTVDEAQKLLDDFMKGQVK